MNSRGYAIRETRGEQNEEKVPLLFVSGTVVPDPNATIKTITGLETHFRPRHNGKLNGWAKGAVTYLGDNSLYIRARGTVIRFREAGGAIYYTENGGKELKVDEESAATVRDMMSQTASLCSTVPIRHK